MYKYRVGLSLIALCSTLALTGVASAHYDDEGNMVANSYGPFALGVPGHYASCFKVKGHEVDGKYVGKHYVCHAFDAAYVCTMYALSITPKHTDKMCTTWKWVHTGHYHHWYKVYGYAEK